VPKPTALARPQELPVVPCVLLRVAAWAIALQAAAMAIYAVVLAVVQLSGHGPKDAAEPWGVAAMAVIGAVALGLLARGLAQVRRWARTPSLLTQLIGIAIGVGLSLHGGGVVGVPLTVVTLAGLVGLLAPATTHQLADR
jgi:hypothetical protein